MSKPEIIQWTEQEPYTGDDRQQVEYLIGFEMWEDEQLEKLLNPTIEDWVKDLIWKDLKNALIRFKAFMIEREHERQPVRILTDDELPF